MAQLVKYSHSNPGRVKVAGYGVGSIGHLATLMIAQATGADLTHVPYQGGPQQVTDTMGGQVPLLLDFESQVIAHLASGKLKALAVANDKRMPNLPEVPTFAELGYSGLVISAWAGILVRAGTPLPVVRKLSGDLAKALAAPDLREFYTKQGATDIGSESPEAFAAFIRSEHDRWGRVIREAGVRIE
jgi:tripartite-type tricarboxylate transporter receptor subunit TctC